jgi:hypothetical protein
MFVALARTSLIYIIPLAIIFAFLHFSRRITLLVLMGLAMTMVSVWFASPYLRGRIEHIAIEYKEYRETNRPTSTGLRLAYVAIQWGLLGCIVLYTMWYFHYGLFSAGGFVGWIGLVVVIQNVISSLLNSHLRFQ